MTKLNGYDLSRSWFDFAFENPDKISPNHAALFFFAIENCNRLGWKKQFGLPATMAMEAIGIRSYNTYKKVFDDLVEWGFFKLVQKSKNQYSSNVIALSIFEGAIDKALDKALTKHITKHPTKQSEYNKTIEQINKETHIGENEKNWKNDFDTYIEEMRTARKELFENTEWLEKQQSFNPGVDIKKSIDKSCVNYWATEAGWKNKKRKQIKTVDWKATFANAISSPQNRVYLPR